MPTEYSLQDLAKLADVTPRTIRYYIVQGLVPSPTQLGAAARYTEAHLDLLRLIKKLQVAHLPLAEIRARLRNIPEDGIASVAEATPDYMQRDSATDYINRVLGRPIVPPAPPAPPQASMPAPAASMPAPEAMPTMARMPSMREPTEVPRPAPQKSTEPDRA
ncbi:MAG: MerR family transcriptional regulator, partial [Candidatus Limnocylindrales bacterium]